MSTGVVRVSMHEIGEPIEVLNPQVPNTSIEQPLSAIGWGHAVVVGDTATASMDGGQAFYITRKGTVPPENIILDALSSRLTEEAKVAMRVVGIDLLANAVQNMPTDLTPLSGEFGY